MKRLQRMKKQIRGWLPKEPIAIYETRQLKSRWRKPVWIALTLAISITIVLGAYVGVQTWLRYSNPRLDVIASYFEKTLNSSIACTGDVVEVQVLVYWHGYVAPEFEREVEIIDPLPESYFEMVGGSNTYLENSDYGGSFQLKYLLRVIGEESTTVELPKPRLYLDNSDIPLKGANTIIELQTFSNKGSLQHETETMNSRSYDGCLPRNSCCPATSKAIIRILSGPGYFFRRNLGGL